MNTQQRLAVNTWLKLHHVQVLHWTWFILATKTISKINSGETLSPPPPCVDVVVVVVVVERDVSNT